jgi:prepilin signal peptidase PulO-like enzyme (type II secretory pathway)
MVVMVVGALLGWHGVIVSLFGGSMIGSVLGITAVVVGRLRGAQAPTEDPAEDPPAGATEAAGAPDARETPSVMRTELPFGPFLAMAAVLYLFAEPWIEIHFHLPGG